MPIAGKAIAGSLALLGVGLGIVIALRPAPAALEPTAVGPPAAVRQASAMGTMAPQAAMAPTVPIAAQATPPKPLEVAKTLEQALQIAATQAQPPPLPAIAKATSLPEAIEMMLAAERAAKGGPPPGTAGINPFATAAAK